KLWDLASGKELARHDHPEQKVTEPTISPDGRTLAAWTVARNGSHWHVQLWETATGKACGRLASMPAPPFFVPGLDPGPGGPLAFSPDSKILAVRSGKDHAIHLWDIATAKELTRFAGHQAGVHALAFSPNGRALASGSSDTTILI